LQCSAMIRTRLGHDFCCFPATIVNEDVEAHARTVVYGRRGLFGPSYRPRLRCRECPPSRVQGCPNPPRPGHPGERRGRRALGTGGPSTSLWIKRSGPPRQERRHRLQQIAVAPACPDRGADAMLTSSRLCPRAIGLPIPSRHPPHLAPGRRPMPLTPVREPDEHAPEHGGGVPGEEEGGERGEGGRSRLSAPLFKMQTIIYIVDGASGIVTHSP
jgi:hypothetical protein